MSINETCSEEDDIGGITELLYHCDSLPSQEGVCGKQLIGVYNITCFQNSKEIVLKVSSSVMGHVKLRVISGISSMLDML